MDRHLDRYHALAFRSLGCASQAHDVVQDCWIKLWNKPFACDSTKSRFSTWFYRVVINACHDVRRHSESYNQTLETISQQNKRGVMSPQQCLEQRQNVDNRQKNLERAIIELPDSQRDALNLVVYNEVSIKQAASILAVTEKAVESLLFRARQSLKAKLNTQIKSKQYEPA